MEHPYSKLKTSFVRNYFLQNKGKYFWIWWWQILEFTKSHHQPL